MICGEPTGHQGRQMINSSQRVYGVTTSQVTIGLSASIEVSSGQYVVGVMVSKLAGNSLAIVGVSNALPSTGYIVGASEVVKFDGPANFFLAASGATTTASVMKLLGDGSVSY